MPANHEAGRRKARIETAVPSRDRFNYAGDLSLHLSLGYFCAHQFFAHVGHIRATYAHLISSQQY
jgi:hypothetical protein